MSEKRQRKKIVKTGNGEPVIKVTDEVDDGRVPGTNKLLLDEKVHEMLKDDQETPPPPYAPREERGLGFSTSSSLTGIEIYDHSWIVQSELYSACCLLNPDYYNCEPNYYG